MKNFQTVNLSRGRHDSPDQGVCVMELASMLAGQPFNDRPDSVCPVVAAFLRTYNDLVDDTERASLYRYAALALDSSRGRRLARRRARMCRRAALKTNRSGFLRMRLRIPVVQAELTACCAVRAILAAGNASARAETLRLLDRLLGLDLDRPGAGGVLGGGRAPGGRTRVTSL